MDIHFHPWVGANYGNSSLFGVPFLILGESHYEWKEGVDTPDLTRHLVAEEANDEWSYPYFTRIYKIVIGKEPIAEGRKLFWNSVAYYNYIQQVVGTRARQRPTWQMWQEAREPFIKMLQMIKPRCVLVLGEGLWKNLPRATKVGPILQVYDERRDTRLYKTDADNLALVGRINHPAV